MSDCDLAEWPNDLSYELLGETPCSVDWCRAKRRKRQPPTGKYDYAIRFAYEECGDRSGDYSGLVHVARINAARKGAS